jgi:hypothetical protein
VNPEPNVVRADFGMAWAVKDSFVNYVRAMRDGRIMLGNGAAVTSTRQFYFPFAGLDRMDERRLMLRFSGEVRFLAHHGLMSVLLCNPRIEIHGDAAFLSIEQGSTWLRLAEFQMPPAQRQDGAAMWSDLELTLSSTGIETFGATYSAGETLAPLTVRVPAATTTPSKQVIGS